MSELRWSPIAEYCPTFWNWNRFEDTMKTCVLRGEKAWTNGHLICVGDPPYPTDETISLQTVEPRLDREVYELHPVAVAEFPGSSPAKDALVFDSRHIIQVRYFNLFREKWPACQFFGDEAAKYKRIDNMVPPLLVRIPITEKIANPSEMSAAALDAGALVEFVQSFKLVGVVMCLRSDYEQERITEVLNLVKGTVHA